VVRWRGVGEKREGKEGGRKVDRGRGSEIDRGREGGRYREGEK
jgi:hypothetical protein